MKKELRWWIYREGSEKRREVLERLAVARKRRERKGERRLKAARKIKATARRDAKIRQLWAEGASGRELCDRFELAKSTLSGIVAGLPPRRRYGDPEDATWPLPRRQAPPAPPRDRRPSPVAVALPSADPRSHRGSASGRAKLDEAAVGRLRELRESGWSRPALAREFKVSISTVDNVLAGRNWSHVGGNPS